MRLQQIVTCVIAFATLNLSGCNGSSSSSSPPPDAEPSIFGCNPGPCEAMSITGDTAASVPGNFHGFADPHLIDDPSAADRIWLSYSWLDVVDGTAPDGSPVQMAAVSNHLARSDDGGATFSFVGELWSSLPATDPGGSGETGLLSSETASLASIVDSTGDVTWFGTHLRYFLRPETGYHPDFATGWTVRVTAAASPAELSNAPETVLGVTNTSPAYAPNVLIDQLANLPVADCAMLNNPTLYAENATLYLILECLAFIGTDIQLDRTTVQVFATEPEGDPGSWTWRYVGLLADKSLADELGDETIQQPDVSRAADGTTILIVTPAHADPDFVVGSAQNGCTVIALSSIEPPVLARDSRGLAVVRARTDSDLKLGACTHNARSSTGILGHDPATPAGNDIWAIRISSFRP